MILLTIGLFGRLSNHGSQVEKGEIISDNTKVTEV